MKALGKINKKFIVFLAVTVLILVVIYFQKSVDKKEVTFQTAEAKRGDLQVTILATGTVAPQNRLEIKAPVAGRMEEVLVVEGQKLTKGQIIAWMSSSERAALLDAARAQGEQEFKRWSKLYLPTPIIAPISGTLILRKVEPGQTFTNSDAIFTMSDRLTVKAQVDETDIAQIQLQKPARIILDAYPDQEIPATVDKIAFDATTISSVTTYIVDVIPNNTPDFMRSGMTANVVFFLDARKNVLLIPSEAIKVQEGKVIVRLKGENNQSTTKEIQVGLSDGKQTEVLNGLTEGDVVLISEVSVDSLEKKQRNPFSPMGGSRTPRR